MDYREFERKINKIENDSIHGAVFLTLELFAILSNEIESELVTQQDFETIVNRMKKVHPVMAPIQQSLENVEKSLTKEGFSRRNAQKIVRNVLQKFKENEEKTIRRFAQEIRKYKKVMILSASSTVNEALVRYKPKSGIREVFVLESRPLLEGRRTAVKLAKNGYKVNLIVDAAAGFYTEEVDAVLSGADMVFGDNSIINKIGSFSLALIAEHYNKPFLVGASTNKKTTLSSKCYHQLIEQKQSEEIWKKAPNIIEMKNIYFDFIPAEYITKIISEK